MSITVYIASPYTNGNKTDNVRASLLVADELLEKGFVPFTPLLSHFWNYLTPKPYEVWLKLDKEWLLRCDCVLRLPGESQGADEEVALAEKFGIPVFHCIEEIEEFDFDYGLLDGTGFRGIGDRSRHG